MSDQELVSAIRRLKVETGSLACMGCGHEHNCGVSGCAVMLEAAGRIANQRTHIAALQKAIEDLRAQLDLRRCALCDYWLGETDPRCMCGKSPWGGKTTAKDHYCSHWERHTDWIPVTERLPEVWRNDETAELVNYMIYSPDFGVDIGNYHAKAKRWICMALPCHVTHWMPLPEPPEKDDNDA